VLEVACLWRPFATSASACDRFATLPSVILLPAMGRLVENGTGIEARQPGLLCDVERAPAPRMTGVHRFALAGKIIATLVGNVTDGQERK
jgi:hypothetical protein